MPAPSLTYTLTNGTTADASQLMQNLNDLLNGYTDGTKDLSVAAFTAAGTATFNGNVALGNASGDDITVTGSLASSIPVKTDASFDIGSSSLGLRSIYMGRNSQRLRVIPSASMSESWTLTLPPDDGASGYLMENGGSGTCTWVKDRTGTATNDSASSGKIGEYLSSTLLTGSELTLTTGTTRTITSLALTAGDWDVSGVVVFNPAPTTVTSALVAAVVDTTNTVSGVLVPSNNEFDVQGLANASLTGGDHISVAIPSYRISISGSQTFYITGTAVFTTAAMAAYGAIWARRVR